jgi:hypothetical protein
MHCGVVTGHLYIHIDEWVGVVKRHMDNDGDVRLVLDQHAEL